MTSSAPLPISADLVESAYERIRSRVRLTPVIQPGSDRLGRGSDLWLKLESLQYTGSFKPRGAFNSVLSVPTAEIPRSGVTAASGGNHGMAVAHVAHTLGLPATIFVPELSPRVKRERIAALGATVKVGGAVYDDAQAECDLFASETGALEIHPYDTIGTISGQATLALELENQIGRPDTVLVAVGGGGLAAGVAAWFGDRTRIVTVEPDSSSCLHAALAAGRPVAVPVSGLAADSLGARQVGDLAFAHLQGHVDMSLTVTDEAITAARRLLWSELRIGTEPGGATALAALTAGVYRPRAGEKVAVVICGGNTDPASLA